MVWTNQDAAQLREYLATQSGERLIARLRMAAKMPNAESIEGEALNSRETKGSEKIIDQILRDKDFEESAKPAQVTYFQPTKTR